MEGLVKLKIDAIGQLALRYDKWVKLGASGFILSIIRDGYKIPFVALPPPKVSSNNTSALKDTCFLSEAISDLLRTKRVEILDHQPDIVNPLFVLGMSICMSLNGSLDPKTFP